MREIKTFNKKTIVLYCILLILVIVSIFLLTYSFLNNNYANQGTVNFNNNYYDVIINNVTIDYDTLTKINTKDNKLNFNIKDLYKYKNTNSINIELYNIGNIDSMISNIKIINFSGTKNIDDVDIKLSLKKGDIIDSTSKKMLKVDITCKDENISKDDYIDFDIIISYKEVVK